MVAIRTMSSRAPQPRTQRDVAWVRPAPPSRRPAVGRGMGVRVHRRASARTDGPYQGSRFGPYVGDGPPACVERDRTKWMDTKDFTTRVKGGTWMGRRLGEVLHPTQLGRPGSAPAHANKQHRQTPAATPHALFRQMAITPRIISMHQPRTQLCRHERSWDREFTHAALITRGVEMDLR
jgi:hypothetical protein